jgi:hypothetical protein
MNLFKYFENIKKLDYNTIIIPKQFFIDYKNVHGKEKLLDLIPEIISFIRNNIKEFPIKPIYESNDYISNYILNYNISNRFKNNIFSNKINNIGSDCLKSIFYSFWKSKNGTQLSPIETWKNDNKMFNIIKYRIGYNNSNEVFDLSIHQLIKGIIVNKKTVSFFKPLLASNIYSTISLTNTPTTFDPCCGFGGRLLGFKCKFPEGTYIGCEPNPETFKELIQLCEYFKFKNVNLYNSTLEQFNVNKIKYDFAFTSIPYYNLEKYSNIVEYKNYDDWKNKFFKKITNLKNAYINISEQLTNDLNLSNNIIYKIENNTSHFRKTNNLTKYENIIHFV